jgi:hypothetical protein
MPMQSVWDMSMLFTNQLQNFQSIEKESTVHEYNYTTISN